MKKLDEELDVIKCKIREEDLQEDFKEKLENKLNSACETKEYTTIEDIKKKKTFISKPFYYKAAAVFVCFVMVSSCTFAGGVGDWIKELFCNVDSGIEVAYENGDMIKVDTEYQTYYGLSVKVDYVSLKDDELYIVFNVKTEDEYDLIDIKNIIVENDGKEIFDFKKNNKYEYSTRRKSVDTKNKLIFLTANKKEGNFEISEVLDINISQIQTKRNNNINEHYGEWSFKVDLNN